MSCLYTSLRGGVVCLPMLSVAKHRLENRPEDDAVAHPSAPAPASWTTTCLNCGSPLSGPFCSKCGQRASPPHPALHDLLHDALHELVHWDGKIVETVRCLVTRPGALTCHVLEGRRARYISPVRLYLTCSLIYFLLAAAAPGQGASFGLSVKRPGVNASVKTRAATGQTEEDRRQILAAIPAAPRLLQPLMRRSVEDPQGLQRDAFGAWPKGAPASPAMGTPETTAAKVVLVDVPGAPQTQLRVAAIGAPRSTPDYPSLQVMNMVLGNLFSSRINLNLREAHGYTYGAFSVFRYRKSAGPFYVATGVRTDVTGPAVSEILKELDRMPRGPMTPDELALGHDSIVRSLPGFFEGGIQTVNTLSNLYVYDLGLDYFSKYPQRLNEVTAATAQDAAKHYLVPGKFVIVAVGDKAKITPQLQKLNLGAVETRDADGNVKK